MTGDQLKDARSKLGLSLRAMADALGMNKDTISNYERGVYPIPKYVPLALFALQITGKAKTKPEPDQSNVHPWKSSRTSRAS